VENAAVTDHTITVLLVDDQLIVGEAVRRLLADEPDIRFHFCSDPTKALERAQEIGPTVILQDLVMPEIDGLTLVKFFRANQKTREVPMIVLSSKEEPVIKAQAFAVGANDYLVKLPDRVELIARIRYHSKGYIAQLERNEAYQKLAASQRLLAQEVAEAANYVRSLLPEPIREGPVRVDWRFVPSTQLGGDSFGYHWLDEDHLSIYLLDVSGHGVGASLLSVSAMNVLRSQTLPKTDFRDPGQVLRRLNESFPMEKHDYQYFTIWYGVYQKSARKLAYAGGGHPPAILFSGPAARSSSPTELSSLGPIIGKDEELNVAMETVGIGPHAKLYVFSDGVFEIDKPNGEMWSIEEFSQFLATLPRDVSPLDRLLDRARELHGSEALPDDFSIVEVAFLDTDAA
jgi:sigma-B regulation protein RsbU (phosphoserine phosphatase)